MAPNYGEIICNAVDEIVTAKLQGLQYDITKLCTVVDDSTSYQGKYIVSDGTARYEAFATDVNLKKGNQVQVVIPNGDYTMQKTIIGRISTTNTTPFNYVSPLDTMIKITNNVFDNARTVYGNNTGLLANGTKVITEPIYSLEGYNKLDGYTRLGLSANFRSWLSESDVASGSYGIKVLLYTNKVKQAGEQPENIVYELNFDSSDMIGNPYQFEDYFYQEKCFDISSISSISKLEVYFYQNSNFIDGAGNLMSYQMESCIIDGEQSQLIDKPNNLFVNDVKIFLGYEVGAFTDETLMLYTPNSLTYRYNKEEVKEINLRWIHKIDEQTFELLNQKTFDDKKYEIHWFRYNAECEKINQYAGKDWEELDNENEFYLYFTPDVKNQSEQIKVIGLIKGITTEEGLKTAVPYFSNIITFENEALVPDQTTLNAATALSICCLDNSEGNYLIYDQNGKIINEGIGKGYTRQFEVMYQGSPINNITNSVKVNWIKWYFPKNEATMLVTTEEMYKANEGKKTQEILSYKGVDYIEILREKNGDNIPATTQEYTIDNYWHVNKSNNTIICKANINGVEYQALEELHFGKAGTNGTDLTFCLEFDGNDNALIMKSHENIKSTAVVRAHLYTNSSSENSIGFPKGSIIKWSWHSTTEGKDYITIIEKKNQIDTTYVELECNALTKDGIPSDNYYILKAELTLTKDSQKLEAYLPIPIKHKDCAYIEGAKEIIYDYQGNPKYYNQPYIAYTLDKNGKYQEMAMTNWNINYENNSSINKNELKPSEKGYLPQLNTLYTKNGVAYKNLVAPSFYLAGYNDKICVFCRSWSQPLLVMQSKYDLAMLNEWNGKLTLNEDNGTVLSTMLGAGRKNENNTFSGVLIGDVQAGTDKDDFETLTGVYGLHEGVISYALKEDGTATFGKKGKGQIKIDGNGGTIESGDFNVHGGMSIDLDKGILNIQDSNKNNIISIGDDMSLISSHNYLKVNDVKNNSLIEINDGNYFLQSPDGRTKFDLLKGSLQLSTGSNFIELTTSGDYLFCVKNAGQFLIKMGGKTKEGDDEYYLQSELYNGQKPKKEIIDGVEYQLFTVSDDFQISSTVTISKDTVIYVDNNLNIYQQDSGEKGDEIVFEDITNTYTEAENNVKYDIVSAEQVKRRFLNSLNIIIENVTPSGLKIDLSKGAITGYDLYLSGISKNNTNNKLIIDTSAISNPFSIGKNFRVDWDGSVVCNNITSLKNTKPSGTVIKIGNHFYVNGSSVGGSQWQGSCSGSSGGVRGYSEQSITSNGQTWLVWKK